MRERAVPAADVITPNQFELEHLAGRDTGTMAAAAAAADALHVLGPTAILVTSLHTRRRRRTRSTCWHPGPTAASACARPSFRSRSTGGRCRRRAVFVHYLGSRSAAQALSRAVSSVFGVLARTAEQDRAKSCSSRRRTRSPRRAGCSSGAGLMRRRFVTLDVSPGRALPAIRSRWCVTPMVSTTPPCRRSRANSTCPRPYSCCAGGPSHRARLRIFTPVRELPFAGHPTIGTARCSESTAARASMPSCWESGSVRFAASSRSRTRPSPPPASTSRSFPVKPRRPRSGGDARALAWRRATAARRICAGDLFRRDPGRLRPGGGLAEIRRCRRMRRRSPPLGEDGRAPSSYSAARPSIRLLLHARMFAPASHHGGSGDRGGVAAFAGVLARFEPQDKGERRITIEQGYEMGRPSQIGLALAIDSGRLQRVTIAGAATVVGEGTIQA